ncbi:MAG: hypothetical protein BroJett007_32850 [Chloroflexota bacterium]|nr:MAG: hypothetical protein BroJett007_32850 [Chloroflexota bacterium]
MVGEPAGRRYKATSMISPVSVCSVVQSVCPSLSTEPSPPAPLPQGEGRTTYVVTVERFLGRPLTPDNSLLTTDP